MYVVSNNKNPSNIRMKNDTVSFKNVGSNETLNFISTLFMFTIKEKRSTHLSTEPSASVISSQQQSSMFCSGSTVALFCSQNSSLGVYFQIPAKKSGKDGQ